MPRDCPPSCNTGGNSSRSEPFLDWVRFSFSEVEDWSEVRAAVVRWCGDRVQFVEAKGLFNFAFGMKLVDEQGIVLGRYCFGGEHQRGRSMIELNSSGCAMVRDWIALVEFLEDNDGRLTRVDCAVDFFDGAYGVDRAMSDWRGGAYDVRRPATASLVDDLGSGKGRTFYVGSRASSKYLRVYEKGKQLGDASSLWSRVELEVKAHDYCIPFQILLAPGEYLHGAYPALAALELVENGRKLVCRTRPLVVELKRAVEVANQQVGALVAFLRKRLGWSTQRIALCLTRPRVSKRIQNFGAAFDVEGLRALSVELLDDLAPSVELHEELWLLGAVG